MARLINSNFPGKRAQKAAANKREQELIDVEKSFNIVKNARRNELHKTNPSRYLEEEEDEYDHSETSSDAVPLQSDCYTKNEKWKSVFGFMKSNPHFFINLLPHIMHGAHDDSSAERDAHTRALVERNNSAEPEY